MGCLKPKFNPACHCEPDAVRRGNPVFTAGKTNAVRRFNGTALNLSGNLKQKTVSLRDFFAEKIVAIQFCRQAKQTPLGVLGALH